MRHAGGEVSAASCNYHELFERLGCVTSSLCVGHCILESGMMHTSCPAVPYRLCSCFPVFLGRSYISVTLVAEFISTAGLVSKF